MSPNSKSPSFQPLPRGRHGLSVDVVRASQRERIVKAMLTLVAEHGYADTTVPAVVAASRASRNAFYEFFTGKEECFLAACEEAAAAIFASMQTFGAEADWMQGLRRGMLTYLQWWQDRPGFSRAYLVELPLVGGRAVEQRNRARAPFEELFALLAERIRRELPKLAPLPDFVPRVLTGALNDLIATEVRAGRVARLTELAEAALFVTVKLLADDALAHAAIKTPAMKRKTRK